MIVFMSLFIVAFLVIVKIGLEKRKKEFFAAKEQSLQIWQKINENREKASKNSSCDKKSNDGTVLYAPDTGYSKLKSRITVNRIILASVIIIAVLLLMASESSSISWRLRLALEKERLTVVLYSLMISISIIINTGRAKAALPFLEPQKLVVTPSELIAHNGYEFVKVPLNEIISVYAEYRKPNMKEKQYTDGCLIIETEHKSIEFTCFETAYNIANAINAVLLEQSEAYGQEQANPQPPENPSSEPKRSAISDSPLVRRAFLFLEDGEWDKADELLEQVLNSEPENAKAYVGKLCVQLRVNSEVDLMNYELPISGYANYKRAYQFADEEYRAKLIEFALTPDIIKRRMLEE